MELVARKTFRLFGGGRVKKGQRFTVKNPVIGNIYIKAKTAEHPPREIKPVIPEPVLEPPPPPVYRTRVMVPESIGVESAPRRRGRPRKVVIEPTEPESFGIDTE